MRLIECDRCHKRIKGVKKNKAVVADDAVHESDAG